MVWARPLEPDDSKSGPGGLFVAIAVPKPWRSDLIGQFVGRKCPPANCRDSSQPSAGKYPARPIHLRRAIAQGDRQRREQVCMITASWAGQRAVSQFVDHGDGITGAGAEVRPPGAGTRAAGARHEQPAACRSRAPARAPDQTSSRATRGQPTTDPNQSRPTPTQTTDPTPKRPTPTQTTGPTQNRLMPRKTTDPTPNQPNQPNQPTPKQTPTGRSQDHPTRRQPATEVTQGQQTPSPRATGRIRGR